MKKLSRILLIVAALAACFTVAPNHSYANITGPRILFEGEGGGGGGTGGEGGEGGGGGTGGDVTVTITEKELKERLNKHFQNGLNEQENRFNKLFPELFKKHNIPFTENLEKTIETIGTKLTQSSKDVDQRVLESDHKIKTLEEMLSGWESKYGEKDNEVRNYIINQEIMNAVAPKAVDPGLVTEALRRSYKIERQADGTIKVFDLAGNTIFNSKGDAITLSEAADRFLNERPYLLKTENRGGTGGQQQTGVSGDMLKKDPKTLTEAESAKIFEDFKAGKLKV